MPWKGRPPFLLTRTLKIAAAQYCVNALKGATSISTWKYTNEQGTLENVSMPWKGRPPFLQQKTKICFSIKYVCQCPERGDLHFYKLLCTGNDGDIKCVSMPWKGRPPFLPVEIEKEMQDARNVSMPWKGRPPFLLQNGICCEWYSDYSVNALKGATSISTLASGNPHK